MLTHPNFDAVVFYTGGTLEMDDAKKADFLSFIHDDGKGFVVSDAKHASKGAEGHYGLTGMQERTALIHGEIEIVSEPGTGTTVRVLVPASEARNRNSSSEPSNTKL